MRLYVATKFEAQDECRRIQDVLRDAGHTISHDWTARGSGECQGEELHQRLAACALEDMRGVVGADALVLLPHPRGAGLWVELGIALARGMHIVVCGTPDVRDLCVFLHLPTVQIAANDTELLAALSDRRQVADVVS